MLTSKLIDSVAAGNLTTAVDCLKEGGNPNTLSRDGATAMHIAAGVGTEAVRMMLAYGGNPNVRSVDGSTPLHVAAAWGDHDTLRLLLHNGANPNLLDHEGQRAVDVALSEQHASCVDFLKYYTMLVAIGDQEEGPMYTEEPVGARQADYSPPSHHHHHHHPASDEEDPANLSAEYCDALSRRLSRLLHEGKPACLDVTFPDCPYIHNKLDPGRGAGDGTILNQDYCAGLLDSSGSQHGEEDETEGISGCRCRSNHCCIHKEEEEDFLLSTSRSARQRQESFNMENRMSRDLLDEDTSYAASVEKRMRHKYFPELAGVGDVLSEKTGASGRGNGLADGLPLSCKRSWLAPLSPREVEGHKRSASACGQSSAERRLNESSCSGSSRCGRSPPCHAQARHISGVFRSPSGRDGQKMNSSHSPHGRDGPNVLSPGHPHPEHRYLSCSRNLMSEFSTSAGGYGQATDLLTAAGHRSPCSASSTDRSPHCLPRTHRNLSPHRSSSEPLRASCCLRDCHRNPSPRALSAHSPDRQETTLHRSLTEPLPSSGCLADRQRRTPHRGSTEPLGSPGSHTRNMSPHRSPAAAQDSNSGGCCRGDGRDCSRHTHLQKQNTFPPAEKTRQSPCRGQSPVTIMTVLGGPQNVFKRRGADTPNSMLYDVDPSNGTFNRYDMGPGKGAFDRYGGSLKNNRFHQYGVDSALADMKLTDRRPEFTEAGSGKGDKRDVGAAASCSCHSVDSGYCENVQCRKPRDVSNQHPQLEEREFRKNSPDLRISSKGKYHPQVPPENRRRFETDGQESETSSKVSNWGHNANPEDKVGQSYLPADNVLNISQLVDEDYKILSGNLHARVKVNGSGGASDSCMLSPKPDLSVSSMESFRTCEEASEPEVDSITALDNESKPKNLRPSKSQQPNSVVGKAPGRGYPGEKEAHIISPIVKKEKTERRESFGFNVSEMDDSWDGHSGSHKPHNTLENACANTRLDSESSAPANKLKNGKNERPASSFSVSTDDTAKNARQSSTKPNSSQSLCKSWLPPAAALIDDSDIMTSDGSFMINGDDGATKKNAGSVNVSRHLSTWLDSLPADNQAAQLQDTQRVGRVLKRMSDESVLSAASSVQEFVYRDKENGITLIERRIPSDYSGSSGRPSMESAVTSSDTDETLSYDWSDFVIDTDDLSSSSSSFDVTAGQTMNSQETLKDSHSDSCDENLIAGDDFVDQEGQAEASERNKRALSRNKKRVANKNCNSAGTSLGTASGSQPTEASLPSSGYNSCDVVPIPADLASLSNEAIYQSLKDLGEDPGPVLPSTRQTYLQHLASLQSGKCRLAVSTSQPGYSSELNRMLAGSLDVEDLAGAEMTMVAQFQTPDGRTWREGTIKSCFNYLLLDPRVTINLPLRAKTMGTTEAFKTFVSAVFYIGKGKRSRPYCHLYEAIKQLKDPKTKVSQKVQTILDIWSCGVGVVSLHCFQNVIPVEAYTREACMVDAMGLGRLSNLKKGDYYGVSSTWPTTRRRCMGAFLLHKAFKIFLSEGERQICPLDIQRGK